MPAGSGVGPRSGVGVGEMNGVGESVGEGIAVAVGLGVALALAVPPDAATSRRLAARIATTAIALTAITTGL